MAGFVLALFCVCQIGVLPCPAEAWSIDTHPTIARAATELLPSPWKRFFEYYNWLVNETTSYPDTYYREADPNEASRHYVDLEIWNPENPSTGTLPQAINEVTIQMESAVRVKDWNSVFLDAGRIAHYVADVTEPYHTTVNYDPLTNDGVGVHQLFESEAAARLSEFKLVSPVDVGMIEPVNNVTAFVLETAVQSHSFLSGINRTLIEEGLRWSPELTEVAENRINAAIIATARVWYTAIVRSDSSPPELPEVNELSIVIDSIALNSTSYGVIRLHVTDALGVKTRVDVSLSVDGSTFRGQVANVVPPVGEYVIAVPSGTYNADFVFTAHKEGFRPATVTLRVGTPSPSITIPLPTVVALTVMVAALVALVWYRRTIRHDGSQGKSVVSIVMPTKIAQE
jgi:hypothetical protein